MKKLKVLLIGAALLAVAAIPAIAQAANGSSGSGDTDTPIRGPALEQASSAALDHLGEGTVTDTEVGDEESMYEVEVTLDNGIQVDVQLDEGFNVVGTEEDGANED